MWPCASPVNKSLSAIFAHGSKTFSCIAECESLNKGYTNTTTQAIRVAKCYTVAPEMCPPCGACCKLLFRSLKFSITFATLPERFRNLPLR